MNDIVEHAFTTFVFSSLNIITKMAQNIDTGFERAIYVWLKCPNGY